MNSRTETPLRSGHPPVFAVACWALGLIAFSQLLVAGMALAKRFEESKIVRTEIKEVPKLIAVRVPSSPTDTENSAQRISRPPVIPKPQVTENLLPAPTPVAAPKVGDPRSERMVKQARQARVAGDMGLAIMKLEEALLQSPEDPTIHFEMGLVHEQMGVFDIAAAHYEKVFRMGVSGAGALYEQAAAKLRDGFVEEDPRGKLSLGRPRIYKAPVTDEGERVELTVPVQKAPGEEIELDQVQVSTIFFNRTSKGEIIQLEPQQSSWVTDKWITLPFDFVGGDEVVRITYQIPPQDIQTKHLFGERNYYGQVVSLLYKGEVIDVQAWPRDLAARMPKQSSAPDESISPEFQDSLPSDLDPLPSLLPPPLLSN